MSLDILDSSAWVQLLDDGPNTRHFASILRKLPDLIIPSNVVTEVLKVVLKQRTADAAEAVTDSMLSGLIVPLAAKIATLAADLFIQHKLPLADSIISATARNQNATLWTQDEHFKGLPHVKYFPKIKP